MIFIDGIHMISDTSKDELHEFALSIGLKRHWYRARSFPHYDLVTKRAELVAVAMKAGAVLIAQRDLVRIIQKRRLMAKLEAVAKAAQGYADVRRRIGSRSSIRARMILWDALAELKREELKHARTT